MSLVEGEERMRERRLRALVLIVAFCIMVSVFCAFTSPVAAATEEDVNQAIAEGVEWLVQKQNPSDGSWYGSGDELKVALTGFALTKLELHAYEMGYESPFDIAYPYSENVIRGWSFVFRPGYANIQAMSLQDHTAGASGSIDDPDVNGNGIGLYFGWDGWYTVYTTGIVLMALHASGTPDRLNDLDSDYDSNGFVDTFQEIAQDTADWLSFAQGDAGYDEGGWAYEALDNMGSYDRGENWNIMADNSNSGYAALGLASAEAFGCTVPDWVKTELDFWITLMQHPVIGDGDDGGSSYRLPMNTGTNLLRTGNLVFQMTFCGDGPGAERFDAAMAYIARHWQSPHLDVGWGYGADPAVYQTMFCLMKGFEYSGIDLIDLDGDEIPEHDWYAEFADVLISQQNEDGSWPKTQWDILELPVLSVSWALLTLEKASPPSPVIPVHVDIKPESWPNPINLGRLGVLPVAICGTENLDVTTIDPATVVLGFEGEEGDVGPARWSYEDVATPFEGGPYDGHELGADGYLDIVLHFVTQEIVNAFRLYRHGGLIRPLYINGNLKEEYGGKVIHGKDYVWITGSLDESPSFLKGHYYSAFYPDFLGPHVIKTGTWLTIGFGWAESGATAEEAEQYVRNFANSATLEPTFKGEPFKKPYSGYLWEYLDITYDEANGQYTALLRYRYYVNPQTAGTYEIHWRMYNPVDNLWHESTGYVTWYEG